MKKIAFSPLFAHFLGISAIAGLLVAHFFESQKAARAEAVLADFSNAAAQAEPVLKLAKSGLLEFVREKAEAYRNPSYQKTFDDAEKITQQSTALGQFLNKPDAGVLDEKWATFGQDVLQTFREYERKNVDFWIDGREAADFLTCAEKGQIEPFLSVLKLKKDFLALAGLNSHAQDVGSCWHFDKFQPVFAQKQLGEIPLGQKVEAHVFLSSYKSSARNARIWADGEPLEMERGRAGFSKTYDCAGRHPLAVRAEIYRWNARAEKMDTLRTAADFEIFVGEHF